MHSTADRFPGMYAKCTRGTQQRGIFTPETSDDALPLTSALSGSERPVRQWEASAFGCSAVLFLHVPVEGPLCCAVKHHLYVQMRECFLLLRILRPDLYNTALTPERGRGVWFLSVIFKWGALVLVLAIVSFLWVSQDLVILRFWFSRNLANFKAPVFVVVWEPVLLVGIKEGK